MAKVSERGKQIFDKAPTWMGVVGLIALIVQVSMTPGVLVAHFTSTYEPPPATRSSSAPVRATPVPAIEPPAISDPASPAQPAKVGEMVEAAEGKIVELPKYPGAPVPVVGTIRDKQAKLSYAKFGKPFRDVESGSQDDWWDQRQSVHTETFDNGHDWWGDIYAGVSPDTMITEDKRWMFLATRQIQNSLTRSGAYPAGVSGRDVASQPLTIDGERAWVIARELEYKREGLRATGELSVIIGVDTGKRQASIVWITIPNTHKNLYPIVNQLIASLHVI